jgi:hypothetical protein
MTHHLPVSLPFKMSPPRDMTAENYHAYRQENHREITRIYKKGDTNMEDVLTGTMKTLYADMSTFIKTTLFPSLVVDKTVVESGAAPMNIDNDYFKCEKMKKHLEQIKAEYTNKDKQITTLETEMGHLKNGGLDRPDRHDGYDRDYNHKDDRDRVRDQDRVRHPDHYREAGLPPPPEEVGTVREKARRSRNGGYLPL